MIFKGVDVELTISQYLEPSNIALVLMHNGEPYAYLTKNICELPYGYACIDTNNVPEAPAFIENNGIGEFAGGYIASGFCRYPVYKISEDVVNSERT